MNPPVKNLNHPSPIQLSSFSLVFFFCLDDATTLDPYAGGGACMVDKIDHVEMTIWNALKKILGSCQSQNDRYFNLERVGKPTQISGLVRATKPVLPKASAFYLHLT